MAFLEASDGSLPLFTSDPKAATMLETVRLLFEPGTYGVLLICPDP